MSLKEVDWMRSGRSLFFVAFMLLGLETWSAPATFGDWRIGLCSFFFAMAFNTTQMFKGEIRAACDSDRGTGGRGDLREATGSPSRYVTRTDTTGF